MPTTTIDDRQLHYVDEGVGDDVVVLLHAFPLSAQTWEPQIDALGDRYRLIAPDLAGCGDSDPPGTPDEHTIEAWADDVIGLVAMLGIDRATVVGSSVGADVAFAVLRRARELVGAAAFASMRAGATRVDDDLRWGEQAQWIRGGGDVASIIDRMVDDLVAPDAPTRSETIKLVRRIASGTSREGWLAGLSALRHRPDPVADLDKVDVPAVVIVGRDDGFAPPADARLIADGIAGAGVVEIRGAGHLPNLETPAVFTRAIEDLLDGREARRATGKHSWPASPAGTRRG